MSKRPLSTPLHTPLPTPVMSPLTLGDPELPQGSSPRGRGGRAQEGASWGGDVGVWKICPVCPPHPPRIPPGISQQPLPREWPQPLLGAGPSCWGFGFPH